MKLNLTLLFILLITNISGQNNVNSIVESIVKETNLGKTTYELETILYQDVESYTQILWLIKDLYSDPRIEVRSKAYQITRNIGLKSDAIQVKQKAVSNLVTCLSEKNYGLVKLIIQYLSEFELNCYNQASRQELLRIVREGVAHYGDIVRLSGALNLTEAIPIINQNIKDKKYNNSKIVWAEHLALAKMGDEKEIFFVMREIRKMPISDNVVMNIYPDIIYLDKHEGFNYLMDVVMSDSKNCRSPQPDSDEHLICAYKVIQLIGNHVEGFPVVMDEFGEIVTQDYDELLYNVRNWIETVWK